MLSGDLAGRTKERGMTITQAEAKVRFEVLWTAHGHKQLIEIPLAARREMRILQKVLPKDDRRQDFWKDDRYKDKP